eukprot:381225_1
MSQSNTTNTMKVKVILGQDIRRWRYSKQSKLSSLNEFVASSFNLTTFWLQYEDDEGDRLTLSSQNDFEDAFACAEEENRKSLKVYVIHGSIHNAQRPSNDTNPSLSESDSQSVPNCHEIKQAAIDFLQNPAITKLLPDLHRRIFEEINKTKAQQESTELKSSETTPKWDSPQSVEAIMRNILQNETKFAPIISHELYQKKLNLAIPCFAAKISHHLPILMSFSTDAIASWIPHLAAVIGGGLNTFVSSTDAMSSFFPLMCSFMRQHGDYSGGFDEDGQVIHYGVQCDECNMMPIKGARFKCIVCSNYDVCGQCESLSKHDNNHPLIKFTLNARNAVPPFMGLHEIMTHFGQGPHHWFGNLWKPRGRRNCNKSQQSGFQPHHPPHPHHAPPHHAWWNHHQDGGDHWDGHRGHRGWKRCNRSYQNQWNSFEPHNPWHRNEWCVNRQNEASDASSAMASNLSPDKEKKIKVMADFVQDVTLPDRTYYPTDTVLTKTWKMKNNGEHQWGNHVELVFFKGNESLTLEKRYPVINAKPGQEVEVSAAIKTPNKPGRYCSYYRLQRNGEYFGPRVWVDIFAVDEQNNKHNKWSPSKQKHNKNKKKQIKKQMKFEKKEARLEAKQMKLEAKHSRIASKIQNVSQQLDEQNENEDSTKLIQKQEKLQKQQKKIKQKVDQIQNDRLQGDQTNNKKPIAAVVQPVVIDEEQLLADIADAAVQDLEETLSKIACVCGTTLDKTTPIEAYKGSSAQVNCDICGKFAAAAAPIYHCPNQKSMAHPEGYDLCCSCAEYQIQRFYPSPNVNAHVAAPPVVDVPNDVDAAPVIVIAPPNVNEEAEFVYKEQLEQLRAMGFNDDEKIKNALLKEKGNVQRVANGLLQL